MLETGCASKRPGCPWCLVWAEMALDRGLRPRQEADGYVPEARERVAGGRERDRRQCPYGGLVSVAVAE